MTRRPATITQADVPPQRALPFTPRGLSRVQAATYVGVSPSLFDLMVADHRMPSPKVVNRRRVWDRLALDEAFAALPNLGGDQAEHNPWDDEDAA